MMRRHRGMDVIPPVMTELLPERKENQGKERESPGMSHKSEAG